MSEAGNHANLSSMDASAVSSAFGFSKAETYDKFLSFFYKDMNGEIGRLWQRSIFLATFLVLIFTGYGRALMHLLEHPAASVNFVCAIITLLGVLFSALWIMMAKASKAWQERYEHSLYDFLESKKDDMLGDLRKYGAIHGHLKGIKPDEFSNFLFSLKAGAYSASKINIAVGVISLVFWIIVGIVHSALASPSFWSGVWKFDGLCLVPLGVFSVFSLGAVLGLCRWCKSSSIFRDNDEPKEKDVLMNPVNAKSGQDESEASVSNSKKEQESKPNETENK